MTLETKFEWRSSCGQDYLYAQGQTRRDLGRAIGLGLHRQISAARRFYQAALAQQAPDPQTAASIRRMVDGYFTLIPSEDLEELQGMLEGYCNASGEEMDLAELALQSFGIDLRHQVDSRAPVASSLEGCTNFGCVNPDGSTVHGQNYDSDPRLTAADAFVHHRTAGEPEAFLYRPGACLGMALGKNEAGICMTVSVIHSSFPAPIMTPRSVLVRRAMRQSTSLAAIRSMTDEQGCSPFCYNLIVSDDTTITGAQATPAEQRICQIKRTLVQSNQYDYVDWLRYLKRPSYSKKRQLYAEALLEALLARHGRINNEDLLEILRDEPVICRKKVGDGIGTTVLFFTRESFGRGNPADRPAGRLPI